MSIEDEFKCIGFYGFGSGVVMSRKLGKGEQPKHNEQMYCGFCKYKAACWALHRARVQTFVPDLAKHVDELGKKDPSGKLVMKFIEENGTEPYMAIMMGNTEDGGWVVSTGKPKDREEMTLPYPFKGI